MAVARRPKRRNRSRDGFRQVAIVIGVGTVLAAGLFAGGYAVQQQFMPGLVKALTGNGRGGTQGASQLASAASNNEIYTGSILYLPYEGSNCRQLLFDNRNGRFTDNGKVDCAQASEQSGISSPKQWSAARAKVISMGFRDHSRNAE
jgi:hypothetical protein